jgi:protein-disulfide isomerase
MLNNTKIQEKLIKDIRAGVALGITATPSYVINGELYSGTIPENILAPVLNGH